MYTVMIDILTLNTLSIPDNTHYGVSELRDGGCRPCRTVN